MVPSMTRREWLRRSSAVALAGVALGPGSVSAFRSARFRPTPEADPSYAPNVVSDSAAVRLNYNENPYGPSPAARAAMEAAFDEGCRYPGPVYNALTRQIAEYESVDPDQVLLGAGSSEVLAMAGAAYGIEGGEIVAAYPTFLGLTRYAESVGAYVHWVAVDENKGHDLDEMDRRITNNVGLVYVCNPNNPTGTIVDGDRLRDFCTNASRRAVVFVDEAYYDLVDPEYQATMTDLVRDGYPIIVSRTFSKVYGLAGLRIGYGISRPDIVERLRPFSMSSPNILGLHAASASLKDHEFRAMSIEKIREARNFTYSVLDELGLRYIRSQGNFVFFHTGRDIGQFQADMLSQGVMVGRPFPPFRDWCRVSMGRTESMPAFATALRAVFA